MSVVLSFVSLGFEEIHTLSVMMAIMMLLTAM